ncbi:hypothetical protein AZ46_0211935 [Metabacillus indicus LMG 22858]|nr:hypothetical protein AZ46_0211935 [Metabacillus indicus LMG 22858]
MQTALESSIPVVHSVPTKPIPAALEGSYPVVQCHQVDSGRFLRVLILTFSAIKPIPDAF